MKKYLVQGWSEGANYDAGKAADFGVFVRAANESHAEDVGDARIKKVFGQCTVICATELTESKLQELAR